MDKQFDSFILKRCESFFEDTSKITEEQVSKIRQIYEAGFQDALIILQEENTIKIQSYI